MAGTAGYKLCGPRAARRYLILVNMVITFAGLMYIIIGCVSLAHGKSFALARVQPSYPAGRKGWRSRALSKGHHHSRLCCVRCSHGPLQVKRLKTLSMTTAVLNVGRPIASSWNAHSGCPRAIARKGRQCFLVTFMHQHQASLQWVYSA